MNPSFRRALTNPGDVPRASGDEPVTPLPHTDVLACAPRQRG